MIEAFWRSLKVLLAYAHDRLTIVAAGITVHEALEGAEVLREKGIFARIIDAYSVKPLHVHGIRDAARETNHVLVAHWPGSASSTATTEPFTLTCARDRSRG